MGKTWAQFFCVNFFLHTLSLIPQRCHFKQTTCVSIIKKALDNWLFVTSRRQKDRTKAKII